MPYSHKSFGGHEYYLSRALAQLGHEVVLFTSNVLPPRYGRGKVQLDDTESFEIRRFEPIIDLKENPLIPQMIPSLYESDLDAIHVHEFFQFCSFYGAFVARAKDVSLVLTQHGYYYPKDPFKRLPMKLSRFSYGSYVLRHAKRIIAISEVTKRFLLKLGIDLKKIDVIPTGVDTNLFSPKTKPTHTISNIVPADRPTLLYIGRLAGHKGVKYLIKAFSLISDAYPSLKLCIVGEGPEKSSLYRFATGLGVNKNIIWTGFLEHRLMPGLYSACSIFVLPSIIEPLGIVLLEAMASGKPIIASQTGGVIDVVKEGYNGLLVDPGDANQLRDALLTLLQDVSLQRTLGQNGRLLAKRFFDWKLVAKKIEEMYRD